MLPNSESNPALNHKAVLFTAVSGLQQNSRISYICTLQHGNNMYLGASPQPE